MRSTGVSDAATRAYRICEAIVLNSPEYRPFQRINEQVEILVDALDADNWDSGRSRVEESVKRRAGPPTEQELRKRAHERGLFDGLDEQIARLRSVQELLYERYGDRTHPEIAAIDWWIDRLTIPPSPKS